MKTIFAIVIVVIALPIAIFFYKNALERSKSNKTSLFGSFNNEYGEKDILFKTTPAALNGLEEGRKRKEARLNEQEKIDGQE